MKVADLLESRRANWRELEQLCTQFKRRRERKRSAERVARFGSLYRAACADLALADAYQLPPGTVHYLHQLVGRAHNQLYRNRIFRVRDWAHEMFVEVPRRLFHDGYLRLAFVLFWGIFLTSMYLASGASPVPGFAQQVMGEEAVTNLEDMYSNPIGGQPGATGAEGLMWGFYVHHNTGIGLRCFAAGLLLGVGGLFATVFNAAVLGAAFGHMTTVPQRDNFFEFVTAHGPFELTAIVLSAAAGMRLGFSLVDTEGMGRLASLRQAAREAMPSMGAAMAMFFMAAVIEGFLSPSSAPYEIKAAVAALSCGMLLTYFVVLGYPQEGLFAEGPAARPPSDRPVTRDH